MDDISKKCSQCGTEKPINQYYCKKMGKGGKMAYCKLCANKMVLKHNTTDKRKEYMREYMREYRSKN